MYLLQVRPYSAQRLNFTMIGSEILAFMFLLIMLAPYLEIAHTSPRDIADFCIKVVASALCLNVLSGITNSFLRIYKFCQEKKQSLNKIVPAKATFQSYDIEIPQPTKDNF
jgi:hypothetical protein